MIEPFIVKSLLNTANNVVNKVADDHSKTLEKEKEIAREQEQTKRVIAQEEGRIRRELADQQRKAFEEIQKKRQAHPFSTVCPGCTATMELDRRACMLSCPYCGQTVALDPCHAYDPMIDDPDSIFNKIKGDAPVEREQPAKADTAPKQPDVYDNHVAQNLAGSGVKMGTPRDMTKPQSVVRPATAADKAAVNTPPKPVMEKVAEAAKLIDTKPVENYVKHKTSGYILPVISLVCGIVAMISCGAFIIPELAGIGTGIIPIFSGKYKAFKYSRAIAGAGILMSFSATAVLILSIFILKK